MNLEMTITELVRDTGREAELRARRGDSITVRSGGRVMFRIEPPFPEAGAISAAQLKEFEAMAGELAGSNAENPIVKLRAVRA